MPARIGGPGAGVSRGQRAEASVAAHDLDEPVVRQAMRGDAIAPGHRLGGDQRVDDRLLGRLDRGLDQRVERPIHEPAKPEHAVAVGLRLGRGHAAIAGREAQEDVARGGRAKPADPRHAERRPPGQPGALVREQRARRSRRCR